ncbi:MAG: alpha/beta fold hydrolase [Burkholderiales bacterium]|nr:alpha/beta fold hydrolase [Burkholderiales bacterium]
MKKSIVLLALAAAGCASQGVLVSDMGSFHVGGREHTVRGQPVKTVTFTPGGAPATIDPNGVYQVEQMYVQWFKPARERGTLPLLMWHGGGLTGVTYETTPDGRPGWLNYFLRQGWTVYNSDAVERGRSGWAMYPEVFKGEPVFLTKENPFERFRIGAGPGSYNKDPARMRLLPGSQFPPEGYDNFTKQGVPRWTTTDVPIIAAYTALVDRVCPCVVLAHSQGGPFAFRVAQARPDKVKALVLVEPAGNGDAARAAALKDTPILTVFGDYIEQDARWPTIKGNVVRFLDEVEKSGGKPEVIDLPRIGINGNSHMMMMDRNSDQLAGVIQNWLAGKGFVR